MRESPAPAQTVAQPVDGSSPLPASIVRVLDSRTFERAPTLRALLSYLWKHRDEPIGEYAIATEALSRSPSFDAKTDATVRVQISRLRQRLEKFYAEEGKDCAERVVIPLGTHQVKLETVALPELETPPAIVKSAHRGVHRGFAWACAALAVLSACLGLALFRAVRTTPQNAPPAAPRFWTTFFGNGRPTRIILPTPVFFSFQRGDLSTVMIRDTFVNEFADSAQAPLVGELSKRMGSPRLAQNYTVTSDTFASVSLVRYLDRFSLSPRVRSSADAPMEALDSENVIAIGTWGTLTPLKGLLDRMNLQLGPHEQEVLIRNPQPGEPARIESVLESPERSVWPGVVAVLPGPDARTRLLILASRHTSALVSTLTSANGLEQVEQLWHSNRSPDFFEMVVNSEMEGMNLVRSWPVLMHRVQVPARVTPRN